MALLDVNIIGSLNVLDGKAKSLTRTAQLGFNNVFFLDAPVSAAIFHQNSNFFKCIQGNLEFFETFIIVATQFLLQYFGSD